MAWGIGDLINWAENLKDTFSGGTSSGPNAVGNNAIQKGIVNPLKVGAELSGVNQMYKGIKPNASNVDRGLAALTLLGWMSGGASSELMTDPRVYAKGPSVLSKLKGAISPEYAYGIHVSPQSGLKTIKPGSKVGVINGGNFGDADNGMAYFFKSGNDRELTQMQEAVNNYLGRLASGTRGGATAYSVRTPLKYTSMDENMGKFATKTPKNLKVINSSQQRPVEVLWDFVGGKQPGLPENQNQLMQSMAKLIQDNPKYSTRYTPSIFKPFEEKMNAKLADEIIQFNEFKNRPKPKMVEVVKPNKKATP